MFRTHVPLLLGTHQTSGFTHLDMKGGRELGRVKTFSALTEFSKNRNQTAQRLHVAGSQPVQRDQEQRLPLLEAATRGDVKTLVNLLRHLDLSNTFQSVMIVDRRSHLFGQVSTDKSSHSSSTHCVSSGTDCLVQHVYMHTNVLRR